MSTERQSFLSRLKPEKQSDYVKKYLYLENMRLSIYMGVIVVVLELWMVARMTRKALENHMTGDVLAGVFEKYFANYFILLAAGTMLLLYAVRAVTGRSRFRWASVLSGLLGAGVSGYSVWLLMHYDAASKPAHSLHSYIANLLSGIGVLILSVCFFADGKNGKDNPRRSTYVRYVFSFTGIAFGIILSANAYIRGEQVMAFLTMEMFVVCMMIWRPIAGFCVLTGSYLVFFGELSRLVAFNSPDGLPGLTESSVINGFTLWISTLMFCIANYCKIYKQAVKSENLEKVNAHLSEISVRDELTGIHNMLYFRTEAEKLLSVVTTDRSSLVYLFLDIENFKSYNGKYGFHAGNELLIQIAGIIEKAFCGSLVSRYSDDHFVVLTKAEGFEETIASISEEIHKKQREVQLSLKCGAYQPGEGETDPSLACDRARFACYRIKKHFGRTLCRYDKRLEERFRRQNYIVNNIDAAIARGDIRVYYQPVVSAADGTVCGLEALARWQDANYGLLPPGAFISVLEEYRQIHKLDRCIIRQVCRDYREAADNGLPFAPVSLNFSRLDFELCDIVGCLTEAVEEFGVPRDYIDVEVTESALSDEGDFLPEAIRTLRSTGFRVWLDDFGSGYSSLNVLKDYQFDVLKIDMKFLSGFGTNEKTQPILTHIIQLAQELKMVSLTEGVETQEQYDFLRSIGCGLAQGYLFSKPQPIEQLRELVRSGELKMGTPSGNQPAPAPAGMP